MGTRIHRLVVSTREADSAALGRGLTVEEVVAMTDEEQLVWRARP